MSPLASQREARTASPADGEGTYCVDDLTGDGPAHNAALVRLRALLIAVAWFELERRRAQLRDVSTAELARLVRDAGEAASTALLSRLGDYRGQSRFEVWAAKFAIREAAAAARRQSGAH